MIYRRLDSRLRLTATEFDQLGDVIAGRRRASLLTASQHDGVLVDGALHPSVAAMVAIAGAPHRWAVVERFDTEYAVPIRIGWEPSGMATVSEFEGDAITIAATHLELLAYQMMQLLRLYPSRRRVAGPLIMTTAGAIDEAIVAVEAGSAAPADLASVITHFVFGWRVSAGWRGEQADRRMTVLDAGACGLWEVDYTLTGDEADRSTEVVLGPNGAVELLAGVGDIISGRSR